MDGRLEPITLYKLKAFAKRRNRFIAIRGICAVLATILAAMTAVAFIDLLFVLPDWARIALSLTGYGLALLVLYETSLRWFLRPADLRQLARMFEAGHDELDEKVLSAVELGQPRRIGFSPPVRWGKPHPTPAARPQVHDSEQLRALFQKRVALLVKNYRLKVLLPASLVRHWPVMAVAVVVFCIALTTIPELRYAQLMARAFAPTANIARVSSLKIRIVEPLNPEPIVPRGDPLTIVAELSRPSDSEVFIETFADQLRQAPTIIQAEPLGKQRYAATVAIAGESLTYRVFAEKASTRQYTVRSQRRPHATKFHKTYHYPAYSRIEDKQIAEVSGDIKALQSSSVDLAIEVDQPVSDAELQIQIGEKKWFDKLTAVEPTLLRGRIDIVESGTYRVHLVARETKFENKFAPNYEIAALADLVPDVTIDKPKESVILPADEIVRLEGAAKDDLGLLDVEQLIRINSGPWDRVALAAEAGKQYIVKKDWDLLPLELKPGDQVSTKLAATDLKGNRGESLVTQITIGSPGFSVKHLENREIRKHLQQSLQQLADASKQMNQDFQSFREQSRSNPGDTARLHEISLRTQVSAQQAESLAQTAWNAMDDATRRAESRIEADDMILLGRMLSRLRHDALAEAQAYRRGIDNASNLSQEQIDRAADAAGRVEGLANQLRYSHQNILAHLQAQNASREIHRLRNNYDDMLEQARQDTQRGDEDSRKNAWRRLTRQQSAAAKEQQIIEEMLDDLALYAESGQAKQAEQVRDKLANQRGQTEEILKQEEPGSKLTERGGDVRNNLREAAGSLRNIEQTLRRQARKSRDELTRSLAMSADELAQLKWKVEDLARNQKALRDLQNRPNVESQQMTQLRRQTAAASDLAEHRWYSASGQFSDRAAIEDVRPTPAYLLVADTADTAAAVNALHATATDTAQIEQSATALSHIEKAYRVLESGHGLIEAGRALDEMTAQERWDFAQADAFTQPLNYWDDWEKRFRTLPNQLKAADLPGEIRKDLQKAIDSEPFRAVDAEAQQRDNPDRGRRPVAQQMELLTRALADLNREMEPYMEEARKVIAQYAPSLVDQLHAVSKLGEQAETETSQLTGKADEQPLDQMRLEAGRLLSRQQQLNDHIDTIRGSLRRDANIQDLGRDEGRERARDADDAIAMLRQPPPKAEDLLQEAALSNEKDSQKRALEQAVSQQNKLNDALDLITQHYENLEAGNPEQTRLALRQAEEDMALARNMDSRYDKLDEISRMAQMSPEELKALLEGQLPQNPPMQNELGQIVDSTIQQAANGISEMANREKGISNQLDKVAEKQDRQNPQLAQVSDRLKDLAQKARQLADRARNLADNKVADAARKSNDLGAKAQQQFDSAKASLKQGAEKIPRDSSPLPSPLELAEKVEDFAGNVDQAKAELDNAAGKTQSAANDKNTDQANQAVQMTRDAGQEVQNTSSEAKQIAAQLKDLARQRNDADRQLAQVPPEQNKFAQRAKDLAQQAGQLAKEDVPQAAQKAQQAGADASGKFDSAAQAAGDAARQMPTDFSAPPAALAEKVDDFARAMDQAQGDLQSAVGKINAAGSANPDQRSQAANQTRDAQRKAADLKKQGSDLARDLREMARRRSDRFEYTDRRQQEINQMAPEVIDDIARAAIHAERLSRPEVQTLQKTKQAMQAISQNELPDAQHALDQAAHARQAQPPVDRAYDALADQLDNLAELQADAAGPQQGAPADETAKWMARTLDQLEAAQMAQGSPQQAQPSPAAARQTMNQALLAQQIAMAQARAQSQGQARNRAASMFSSDRTSPQMPPETGEELPDRLALRRGDWGKLRTLSATDLMEAGKETVAEDYREMVNMYFLVISQKARQKD